MRCAGRSLLGEQAGQFVMALPRRLGHCPCGTPTFFGRAPMIVTMVGFHAVPPKRLGLLNIGVSNLRIPLNVSRQRG